MATPTYELIETTTLTSSASSVSFSSITQDYRDLVLVIDVIPTGSSLRIGIRVNSDSGSNYNEVEMYGVDGLGAGSGANSGETSMTGVFNLQTVRSTHTYDFLDYSATDKHKSVLHRGGTSTGVWAAAYRWADTSAINEILVRGGFSGNEYGAGTTFSLYGIAS